jgi:glucose/arabinose dehydrogenase
MKKTGTTLLLAFLLTALVGNLAAVRSLAQGHGGPTIGLELVAGGLVAPMQLTAPDDGTQRRFVVDQVGVIRILTEGGALLGEPFLDIRSKIPELKPEYDERGLLGLAFHPEYAENGRFYIYYSTPLEPAMPDSFNHANRLAEYQVSPADPNKADPDSERLLLEMAWPYSNHNGGTIAFGPDGYLYVPLGDGGNRDDEGRGHVEDWYEANAGGNGQDIEQDIEQNLLGSILRIDVDGRAEGKAYGIPPDNPFVGKAGLDEIWAYGLRNPYRIAFDAETGELFAGDAGQNLWEEVDLIVKGGNYGWNVREGTHCFDAAHPQNPPYDCPDVAPNGDRLLPPIAQFDHYMGVVVVGGVPYRGSAAHHFEGKYLFADWSAIHDQPRGTIFVAERPPDGMEAMWNWTQLTAEVQGGGDFQEFVRSFGEDADREAYVLTSNVQGPTGNTGKVYKIVSGSMGGGHSH